MDAASEPSSDNAHMSVFERNAALVRLFLFLVPVLLLDCGAERLRTAGSPSDFRSRHPYFHHGLFANQEAVAAWGTGEPYRVFTNSLGMMDREVREVPLSTSKHRIVFIGDSYTEGLGVGFEETFVGRISQRVDASRVEVLNAAAVSYSPKLYYLKTRYLIENVGLEFDELYVFIDISDVQDEILYANYTPTEASTGVDIPRAAHRFLSRNSFAYSSIDRLRRRKQVEARKARYSVDGHPPWLNYFWRDEVNEEAYSDPDFALIRGLWTLSPKLIESKWTVRGVESEREHMKKLIELCREHSIRMTIAVYPWTPQIQKRDLASIQVWIWENFAAKYGVGFINLFPALITETAYPEFEARYILAGDEHWNSAGHALVADAVWPRIEENLQEARGISD